MVNLGDVLDFLVIIYVFGTALFALDQTIDQVLFPD